MRIIAKWRFMCAVMMFAAAAGVAAAEEQQAQNVVLLELFTSQGCYSCPPADELLREAYVDAPGVLPLEYHVHYWDDLIYGFAGSWKDPFSSPAYTDRQRAYNRKIRNTNSMYTPQIVIHGQRETVGNRQSAIDAHIADMVQGADAPMFYFSGGGDDNWRVRVAGSLQGNEELYYAIYIKHEVTQVTAGENKGKSMTNTNIVKKVDSVSSRRQIDIPAYDKQKEGCAVWLQKPQTGRILAAAQCPS